jgi:hypothetical protein
MQKRFAYCAWFRDLTARDDDPDLEWPACFIVQAATSEDALKWGDHLSLNYSRRCGTELFLRSDVQDMSHAEGDWTTQPVIPAGYEAGDADIGW